MSGTLPTVSLFVAKSTLTEGTDTALNAIVTRTPSELTSSVCQSALNWDPRSARKRDPLVRCVEGAFRRGS